MYEELRMLARAEHCRDLLAEAERRRLVRQLTGQRKLWCALLDRVGTWLIWSGTALQRVARERGTSGERVALWERRPEKRPVSSREIVEV